jgi:formamidopyrimidine-DNA glycosylase
VPELPEVETIKRGLEPKLVGQKIEEIMVLRPKQLTNATPLQLCTELKGDTIDKLVRRGKYLLLFFIRNQVLVIHLRMTGQLIYYPKEQKSDSYTRLVLTFDSGAQLHLRDVRALAKISLLRADEIPTWGPFVKLGPEPLTATFTVEMLQHSLSKRRTAIKNALLGQKVVAGLGNIYADEALFKAHINPLRPANTLNKSEVTSLHVAIKQVLTDAITYGGTSFRDYVNASGVRGSNQERLLVYGRRGQPCYQCDTTLEGRRLGGRSTVYCPKCQPLIRIAPEN